jgi:hypothetical protein
MPKGTLRNVLAIIGMEVYRGQHNPEKEDRRYARVL